MSDVPIPSYKTSCLAADEGSDYFYLIGSAAPGLLTVNYVPDIFAKTVRQQATDTNMDAWSPAAEKAAVKIMQFGTAQTWFSSFQGNTIQPATYANSPPSSNAPNSTVRVTFLSAKLLAWTGISADSDMFTMYTDFKYGPQGTQWAALSLRFGTGSSILFDYRLSTFPVSDPLLTLGTFAPANGGNSSGYTIVFDKNRQGMIYSTFACLSAIPAGDPLMTLSGQTPVGMNNIVLTKYAIPVTMASRGYILDRAQDNITTIIYSITPSEDPNLSQVKIVGGQTLPFSASMSAAALGSKIIVYSAPDGATPAELVKLNSDVNKNGGGFGPGYLQYEPGYVQYDHGYVTYDQGYTQCDQQQHQGHQFSPTFFPPPPTPVVSQDSDESYKPNASASSTNNPYISPSSYRDTMSFLPVSPESILTKTEVTSVTHGPQYVPSISVSPSNARSPQGISSISNSS
ncbi:hypothetical protein BGZ96_000958 [Linnemannia gamsii]|uniref:Uncharacterized protein n=1 Tax=Linnemannia gamsii TaxID=64522 RepID=A0ABQ7JN33_9FUNG|nr:hypothetical protein BGZ96_000958 [Linnemannia gamsii]